MRNKSDKVALVEQRRRKSFVFEPDGFLHASGPFKSVLADSVDADSQRAVFLLRIVAQLVRDYANEWLAPYDLTIVKYSYLIRLYVAPKKQLTLNDLARYVNTTNATVTTMINALEHDGLVRRISNPEDRRSTIAELTAKGTRAIVDALPEHNVNIQLGLSALTKPERKQLSVLLRKVAEGFERRFGSGPE